MKNAFEISETGEVFKRYWFDAGENLSKWVSKLESLGVKRASATDPPAATAVYNFHF